MAMTLRRSAASTSKPYLPSGDQVAVAVPARVEIDDVIAPRQQLAHGATPRMTRLRRHRAAEPPAARKDLLRRLQSNQFHRRCGSGALRLWGSCADSGRDSRTSFSGLWGHVRRQAARGISRSHRPVELAAESHAGTGRHSGGGRQSGIEQRPVHVAPDGHALVHRLLELGEGSGDQTRAEAVGTLAAMPTRECSTWLNWFVSCSRPRLVSPSARPGRVVGRGRTRCRPSPPAELGPRADEQDEFRLAD